MPAQNTTKAATKRLNNLLNKHSANSCTKQFNFIMYEIYLQLVFISYKPNNRYCIFFFSQIKGKSLIDFHLINYRWSEKWKFQYFFFSEIKQRERERERERETCNWTMGRRRGLVVGDEIVDHRASTSRRREMSSDFEVCVREFSTCELWTKMVFVFVFFILTLFQGLKILGDIFYQGLWQSWLEKCLNSEGKIHAGELNVFLFF